MIPKWFDFDKDDLQFICVYQDATVAVGNMRTITDSHHDAAHYDDPSIAIVKVYRMLDGIPVQGRIVSLRDDFSPDTGMATVQVSVYGPGKSMPLWARGTWLLDGNS